MHFELSEEHKAVQEAARDFAQNVLKAGVIERDEHQKFPADEIKQLAELGFMGMMVDTKYGGSGMDTLSYVLAMEEISKIDASVSVCMSVNNSLVTWGLEAFGSEEQKQKFLVPLAKGEKIGNKTLKDWLFSQYHLPLHKQKETFEKQLQDYMKGVDQRDDILWIGVKMLEN